MQAFRLNSAPWFRLSNFLKLTDKTRSRCVSTAAKAIASDIPAHTFHRGGKLESLAFAFVTGAVRNTSTVPLPSPISTDSQSPAQISRAAAQAVRIAFKQGSFKECYTIIRSLRQSKVAHDTSREPGSADDALYGSAFDFGQAVSSRLTEHVLLHCLLRDGQTLKAGELVKKMLHRGLRVHPNSVNITVQALCATDIAGIEKDYGDVQVKKPRMECLNVRPTGIPQKLVQSRATNMALLLFFKAKQYERQRSWHAFQSLVDACMLQGEILVISFLLAFLVKQWQVRTTTIEVFEEKQRIPGVPCSDEMINWSKPKGTPRLSLESREIMNNCFIRTVQYLEDANGNHRNAYKIVPPAEESAQALVNVTSLIPTSLNFPKAHQVLSIARRFRSASMTSWAFIDGNWQKRLTKQHLDEFLNGVVNSIATTGRDDGERQNAKKFTPEVCDQLLLHAIGSLKSTDLATAIIDYKMKRNGGFIGIAAQQIILRACSTTQQAKLRSFLADRKEPQLTRRRRHPCWRMVMTTKRILGATLGEPARNEYLKILSQLPKDESTLTSVLVSLNTSGYHDLVIRIVLTLFPELRSRSEEKDRFRMSWLSKGRFYSALQKTTNLGPYFFVAVLDALRRGNQLILAWLVWGLAKRAESLSWQRGARHPDFTSWCLPISAYNIMLHISVESAKRGIRLHQQGLHAPSQALPLKRRRYIPSESDYLKRKRKDIGCNLFNKAQACGTHVIRSVEKSARAFNQISVPEALKEFSQTRRTYGRNVLVPKPDARFFELALNLHTLRLDARHKRRRLARTFWKRVFRRARRRFILRGRTDKLPREWTGDFMDTLSALHETDVEVPVKYQACLLGTPPDYSMRALKVHRTGSLPRVSLAETQRLVKREDACCQSALKVDYWSSLES